MNKIKALIVDDEPHAHELLRNVLTLFPNPIEIIGEANDLPEAVRLIQEKMPLVVFMDIDMPNFSGLELNRFMPENHKIIVVYITAHSEYAIEALRASAFDYLLKPIHLESLKKCIGRLENEMKKREDLVINAHNESRIEISNHQFTRYIAVSDVFYIQASSMYAIIQTETEQFVVSKPLKSFNYLQEAGFYRVHRSYLVNTKKIKTLSSAFNEVTLINKIVVPVSRAEKEGFRQFMRK